MLFLPLFFLHLNQVIIQKQFFFTVLNKYYSYRFISFYFFHIGANVWIVSGNQWFFYSLISVWINQLFHYYRFDSMEEKKELKKFTINKIENLFLSFVFPHKLHKHVRFVRVCCTECQDNYVKWTLNAQEKGMAKRIIEIIETERGNYLTIFCNAFEFDIARCENEKSKWLM